MTRALPSPDLNSSGLASFSGSVPDAYTPGHSYHLELLAHHSLWTLTNLIPAHNLISHQPYQAPLHSQFTFFVSEIYRPFTATPPPSVAQQSLLSPKILNSFVNQASYHTHQVLFCSLQKCLSLMQTDVTGFIASSFNREESHQSSACSYSASLSHPGCQHVVKPAGPIPPIQSLTSSSQGPPRTWPIYFSSHLNLHFHLLIIHIHLHTTVKNMGSRPRFEF